MTEIDEARNILNKIDYHAPVYQERLSDLDFMRRDQKYNFATRLIGELLSKGFIKGITLTTMENTNENDVGAKS